MEGPVASPCGDTDRDLRRWLVVTSGVETNCQALRSSSTQQCIGDRLHASDSLVILYTASIRSGERIEGATRC